MVSTHETYTTNRTGATDASRLGLRRRLASPDEAFALFADAGGPAGQAVESRRWNDVRVVRLRLPHQGGVFVPPPAFYSVAAFTGIAPHVHCHTSDSAHAIAQPHAESTLIHGMGIGFRYVWTAPHRADWVCLETHLISRVAAQCGIARAEMHNLSATVQRRDATCEYLVGALVEEARRDSHAAQALIVESIANALACRLVTHLGATLLGPLSPPGALDMRAFRQVREYIDANLGARIFLDDLARVAGVSRFHFARQFRLRTRESPMGYVMRARIEHAKAQLRETSAKIADIAATLGFADQSHFTRTFKRLTGISPSAFSLQYRSARTCKLRADDSIPASR
jgi:AraC family transcriptional regulator